MPRDHAPAASTTISAARCRPIVEHDAPRPPALDQNLFHRPMLVKRDAGRLHGNAQRLHELAVVDLMIFRRKQRAGDLAGQMGLAGAGGGSRQPFERQIEPPLKLQTMADLRLVVGREREHQRALAAQFDVDPAGAQQVPRQRPASAPGSRGQGRPDPPRPARPRSTPPACRPPRGSRPIRPRPGRIPSTAARPASRQPMPSPTTPAPMIATRGLFEICGKWSVRRGSLRWNDPDRFDGFDLSRAVRLGAAPLANTAMMGV